MCFRYTLHQYLPRICCQGAQPGQQPQDKPLILILLQQDRNHRSLVQAERLRIRKVNVFAQCEAAWGLH